jgi:hypothetical protein
MSKIYRVKNAFGLTGDVSMTAEPELDVLATDITDTKEFVGFQLKALQLDDKLRSSEITDQIIALASITSTVTTNNPGTLASLVWAKLSGAVAPNVISQITVPSGATSKNWTTYVDGLRIAQLTDSAQGTATIKAGDTLFVPIDLTCSNVSPSNTKVAGPYTVYLKFNIIP